MNREQKQVLIHYFRGMSNDASLVSILALAAKLSPGGELNATAGLWQELILADQEALEEAGTASAAQVPLATGS
jgi:hypothetical protein